MKDELRSSRCCFAGQVPQALKRAEDDVRVDLENCILAAVSEGFTTFISGLSPGTDIWAAEIVVRLKTVLPRLHLVAAIPFPGFDEAWEDDWRTRYRLLLSQAEYVKVLKSACTGSAFLERDDWMVRHSAKMIAVTSGQPGGTREAVRRARMYGIMVKCIPG